MTSGEKSFTKTGRMRRATYSEVCEWILKAWEAVKVQSIRNGFRKAGIIGVAEDGTPTLEMESSDDSDSSVNEAGSDTAMADEAILRLFVSDTEESDFEGFTADDLKKFEEEING